MQIVHICIAFIRKWLSLKFTPSLGYEVKGKSVENVNIISWPTVRNENSFHQVHRKYQIFSIPKKKNSTYCAGVQEFFQDLETYLLVAGTASTLGHWGHLLVPGLVQWRTHQRNKSFIKLRKINLSNSIQRGITLPQHSHKAQTEYYITPNALWILIDIQTHSSR